MWPRCSQRQAKQAKCGGVEREKLWWARVAELVLLALVLFVSSEDLKTKKDSHCFWGYCGG